MEPPVADLDIDPDLVARLIRSQHPDLAGPLTRTAHGWDNDIYRLGDDLCVRLPRRHVAAELIANEQRWLPELAGRLGTRVPVPVRVGRPDRDYPYPWSIVRWFDGLPAGQLPPAGRAGIAEDLARFMAAMHVPAPDHAPRNPVRGVPLAHRTPAVRERLASGLIPHAARLLAIWDELTEVPAWAGPPLWLHGDPHPANLLVRPDPDPGLDPDDGSGGGTARLCAVLDFGDLTSGDPATDLAAAWLVFDPPGRRAFRAHVDRLTGTDAPTWARARGWALGMGTAMAVNADSHPRTAAAGRHALDQVLLDS
ncbi:hypothetical protein GCM10023322_51370 [Rugosimonospora acidiphila]|uniref:Aminoglycoside phosphotransferase domain-containing protein n=1 Tax=Rugosimonospora acidiphila TaxID=556531 RepID=A0ABP9S9G3_9ACTN